MRWGCNHGNQFEAPRDVDPPFVSIILSLLIKVVKKCWLDQIMIEKTSELLPVIHLHEGFTEIKVCSINILN